VVRHYRPKHAKALTGLLIRILRVGLLMDLYGKRKTHSKNVTTDTCKENIPDGEGVGSK